MISLTSSSASRLNRSAYAELATAHHDAWADIQKNLIHPSQHEARHVAHLCKRMRDVAKTWSGELAAASPTLKLSMATVFTHQSPKVKWTSGHCELADLLIAFIDRSASPATGRAVLIQAKISSAPTLALSTSREKTQFDLLSTRPVFDVQGRSAPKSVDLTSFTPDSALLYGLTGPMPYVLPLPFVWPHYWITGDELGARKGTYNVVGEDCLAFTLVGMLLGSFGWKFDLPPPGSDWNYFATGAARNDWSALVNYLLNQTMAKPLGKIRQVMGTANRGYEQVLCLARIADQGQPMFCMTSGFGEELLSVYSDNGLIVNEVGGPSADWRVVDDGKLFEPGDGGGDDGRAAGKLGDEPEDGPISVVVFDVSRSSQSS